MQIDENFRPTGYNIGFNAGEAARQTVMHCHCHVIPRYVGDVRVPRGGVRYIVDRALEISGKKIPVTDTTITIQGGVE